MKKIKNLIANYPFLRFLVNRYILVLLFFIIWMLFFDRNDMLSQFEYRTEVKKLQEEKGEA